MIKNVRVNSGKFRIVETGIAYGNMNTAKRFYPEDYTVEDRQRAFLSHRLKAGKDFGFDGHKMFMADQTDKTGTWFELDQDCVEANPNGWSDISEDILVITDDVPSVVIGHPVADCPVVMAFDVEKGVAAIGHCSADLVDIKMPMLVVDALLESYGSRDEDIVAYVSMCAGISWTYDSYPKWAKDEKMWEKAITLGEDGLYHINLKRVVRKQLLDRNVAGVLMSPDDTITDPRYYSNSAAFNGDSTKNGRNFAGTFFTGKKKGSYQRVLREKKLEGLSR
ncbi:MAG: laccase domain-containing protein [Bacilli bacterium]|nr:laccase domain-containing protein [Bacilli bacterium]